LQGSFTLKGIVKKTEAILNTKHTENVNREILKLIGEVGGEKRFFNLPVKDHDTNKVVVLRLRNFKAPWNPLGLSSSHIQTHFQLDYMKLFISTYFEEYELKKLPDGLKRGLREELLRISKDTNPSKIMSMSKTKVYLLKENVAIISSIWNDLYSKMRKRSHSSTSSTTKKYKTTELFHWALQDCSDAKIWNDWIIRLEKSYQINNYESIDDWIDNCLKKKVKPIEFFRLGQKSENQAEFIHEIPDLKISRDKAESNLPQGTYIVDPLKNPKIFLNEKYSLKSWVGVGVGGMKDFKVRCELNAYTRTTKKLTNLKLDPDVISETSWAHSLGNGNINLYSDSINKNAKNLIAKDQIQFKFPRDLGYGFNTNDYALDRLKTMGLIDPTDPYKTINLRIDFFPSNLLLALNNYSQRTFKTFAQNKNMFIVRYWGRGTEEFGRLGEVLQAIRLARFRKNGITDFNSLVKIAMIDLKRGEEALGYSRTIDVITKNLVKKLACIASNRNISEGEFYRNIFLDLMKKNIIILFKRYKPT